MQNILIDVLAIAFNALILDNEKSNGWRKIYIAFMVYWIINLVYDTFVLFMGVN